MIIFNEKEHAEKVLKKGFITPNQQIRDLFILAKYLYYIGNSKEEVYYKLEEFMNKYGSEYSGNIRQNIIKKTSDSAEKGILVYDKKIQIYESEIEAIQELKDIELGKLLFSYIVLSKFFNGLFKISRNELFRLAMIDVDNRKKPKLIHKLNRSGKTITTTVKGNTLRGVNLKEKGKVVIEFKCNTNFILHYLKYIGDNNVLQCNECDALIYRIGKKPPQYCKECSIRIDNLNRKFRKK